jgi:hypothetical protein
VDNVLVVEVNYPFQDLPDDDSGFDLAYTVALVLKVREEITT